MRVVGILSVIVSAALGSATLAQNTTMSGADLLDACTRADMNWIDFCNGYFQAAHDFGVLQGTVCTKVSVTRTNLVESFEQIAPAVFSEDASARSGPALPVAVGILSAAYPC